VLLLASLEKPVYPNLLRNSGATHMLFHGADLRDMTHLQAV